MEACATAAVRPPPGRGQLPSPRPGGRPAWSRTPARRPQWRLVLLGLEARVRAERAIASSPSSATTATWPSRRRHRLVGEQEVDLRPLALHPRRATLPSDPGGSTGSKRSSCQNSRSAGTSVGPAPQARRAGGSWLRAARRSQSTWFCLRMIRCSMRCSSASERGSWPDGGMTPCSAAMASSSLSIRCSSVLPGRGSSSARRLRGGVAAERGDLLDQSPHVLELVQREVPQLARDALDLEPEHSPTPA